MSDFKNKVNATMEQIKKIYKADTRPWVIGYSGGKDSTTVTQLIFNAIAELPKAERHKPIYIISSDTLVETPLIISYIDNVMTRIETKASELDLPITTHIVQPEIDKTFWATLIGKGYPSPRQKFRWCTDKLKIDPANKFILNKVSEFGEVIMVLGVRKNESASRDQVLKARSVKGKILRLHSTLNNAYVYAPIENFSVDDVWEYLLSYDSPWGSDNNELLQLYQDSSGECPLVVDKSTPSCGNSRFGCWVCTVVQEDKALKGFIETGERWLIPLLKFRNWLLEIRNIPDKREKKRRNGSVYWIQKEDEERRKGLGPFTLDARKEILEKLLDTQNKVEKALNKKYPLIRKEELLEIRKQWIEDGDWQDSLPDIYEKYTGNSIISDLAKEPIFTPQEIKLLSHICQKEDVPFELIWKLITVETKSYGYKYRHGIIDKIDKVLHEGWLHTDLKSESGVKNDYKQFGN